MLLLFALSALGQEQETDVQNYRTFDGRHNNPEHPEWGAAGSHLLQTFGLYYSDGISAPAGAGRPNPREVSNQIFAQDRDLRDPMRLSDFCWAFGQFLDHDIGLTPDGEEMALIQVPAGDPWFDPFGQGSAVIPMHRNLFDPATGTGPDNPRRHPNVITAFIDASAVYGSDEARADWLRTFEGGKLKTSQGNLLPFNTTTGEYDAPVDHSAPEMDNPVGMSEKLFVAGDVRANENPLLLAFHTLFVREHNRICEELAEEHPNWEDEQLYQHARKIVGGIIQAIVYEEYLPAMGIELPEYQGYDPTVRPQLTNVFTAAAFRMGHTLLSNKMLRMDKFGRSMEAGNVLLRDGFFNPQPVMETGIDPFFQGMASQMQQEFDAKLVDDVRNFLFGPPGAGGLDLASININRGRERGLPDYNTIRRELGLQPLHFFFQFSYDPIIAGRLSRLYGDVNNIDGWVGMLAEPRMRGKLFGETINAILSRQFAALRNGDRFFYLNDPLLSKSEKTAIRKTRLKDVIMRNTDLLVMQDNVFESMPYAQICEHNLVTVSGEVQNPNGQPVANVAVNLMMGDDNRPMTRESENDGSFVFGEIPGCEVHGLFFEKSGKANEGVSTLDLIYIQRHILSIDPLDSPYKMIAADADGSHHISTLDLINIRKVILGIVRDMPGGQNWRFVKKDPKMEASEHPLQEEITEALYFDLLGENMDVTYVLVKVGDVDGSFASQKLASERGIEPRSKKEALQLQLNDRELIAGSLYEIPVELASAKDLAGFQFSLAYRPETLELDGIDYGNLPNLGPQNFGIFEEEGRISTSWNGEQGVGEYLGDDATVFTLRFRARRSARLSQVLRLTEKVDPLAYNSAFDQAPVELQFLGTATPTEQVTVGQNRPNPFNKSTVIPLNLPYSGNVRLTIFDLSGKVILDDSRYLPGGQNEWVVDYRMFPGAGVYYYEVATSEKTVSRKMLLQE